MGTPRRFTARYERDTRGMWVVELAQVPTIHTYGRRLDVARVAMHEAVARWAQIEPDELELVDDIVLPPEARIAINAALERRREAELARGDSVSLSRHAALYLVKELGLTVRDAANLLAVSPSRISQLLRTPPDNRNTPAESKTPT